MRNKYTAVSDLKRDLTQKRSELASGIVEGSSVTLAEAVL